LSSPQLGHYAAANAFLDALAHYRRAQGKPALSINWAFWTDVGMVARHLQAGRLPLQGIKGIAPKKGIEILEQLFRKGSTQVGVLPIDWRQWSQAYPLFAESPLLSELMREEVDASSQTEGPHVQAEMIRNTLLAEEPKRRQRLLEEYCSEEVARVLRLPVSKLDVYQPLTSLGLDSLMAVELKNRLEVDLGLVVPMVSILQDPNVVQLSTLLLEQLSAESVPVMETTPLRAEGGLHTEARRRVTSAVPTDDWEEGEL
jgi:acyl carrier protein